MHYFSACPQLGKLLKGYKNCSMAGGRNVCILTCRKGHSFHAEAETAFVCGPDTKGIWNGLNKVNLPKCSSKLNVINLISRSFLDCE